MIRRVAALAAVLGLLRSATAQQAGVLKREDHVPIPLTTCTDYWNCTSEPSSLTMDANWRWIHDARARMYGNCIRGLYWDERIATDGLAGASGCAVEGINERDYVHTYGVNSINAGVRLTYKTGKSVGSRLYMMEDPDTYKMFKLLNKEFTFDIDVSTLQCGMNGGVYFVEMDPQGGKGKHGDNTAGAKYGTGYCDSQCPRHLKFIDGEANVRDWRRTKDGPEGHYGACCAEMDIWEGNKFATAYTAHPCMTMGPLRCEGDDCGHSNITCKCCKDTPNPADCPCCKRYKGLCNMDGCDYNNFRFGHESFYGDGPSYMLDSSKPITVVTQFLTRNNTDDGDLVEIRRLYLQDGRLVQNIAPGNLKDFKGDSITDQLCDAEKQTFEVPDDFSTKGGLQSMGESLRRGVVLVLSLWDDELTQMDWLDSSVPTKNHPVTMPGVRRGPCSSGSGSPELLRALYPSAYVEYTNLMVGEIGSTYKARVDPDATRPPTTTVNPPFCCTYAAKAGDPCGTCTQGSDETTSFCSSSQETCQGCNGHWCPNGKTSPAGS